MATAKLSTADKNKLDDKQFAFPKERKEPLVDAKHVRNAVSRFDQVEGVTNKERDRAWRRIKAAAEKFGVDIEEKSWHELSSGGKPKKRSTGTKKKTGSKKKEKTGSKKTKKKQ